MAGTVILNIVGNAASGMAALDSIQSGIDQVAKGAKVLGAAFSAVAAAGMAFLKSATMTAARTEVLGTSLSVVAKTAGYSQGQIDTLEAEIKALGITTQNARQGIIRLIQAQVDLSKAAQLARTAQDLAVVSGENSSDTYERLVNAISTMNPRLLRQAGIVANLNDVFGEHEGKLSTAAKKQMLLDFILKEGEKVAGVYAMAMGDVGKAMTSLPRYFEELKNAIGKHFLPLLKVGVDLLSNFLKWFNALPEPVQKFIALAIGLVTALSGIAGALLLFAGFLPTIIAGLKMMLVVGAALSPVILVVGAAIAGLVAAVAVLAKAWKEDWAGIHSVVERIVMMFKYWFGKIADDVKYWLGEIKKAWDGLVAAVKPLVEELIRFVRDQLLNKGGLKEFLIFLRDVVNVGLKLITQFLQTLTGLVKGEEDAWEPLYDGFLNIMTLIALAWEKWISKALTWGWNVIVEIATGMAKAAREVLSTILTQIGNVIKDFLGAFSPPKKGPLSQIAEWGKNLINEYIRSFELADFGTLREALSPIQEALESAVRIGDLDEADMVRIFQQVRGLAAQLFAEFRESGQISENIMRQIGDALGEGSEEYLKYIRLTLEHQQALDRLQRAQQAYDEWKEKGYVPADVQAALDAAKTEVDEKKKAVDWQKELLAFQQESVDLQARLVEVLEDLNETLKGVGETAGTDVAEGFGDLVDAVTGMEDVDLSEKMGLGEFSKEFEDMKDKVEKFFENLPANIQAWVTDKIRTPLQQIVFIVLFYLTEAYNVVDGILKNIGFIISFYWDQFLTNIKTVLFQIWFLILFWFTQAYTAVNNTLTTISTTISTKWEEFKTTISTTLYQIWFLILFWFTETYNAVKTALEDVKTEIEDRWNEAKAFLEGIDLVQIGTNVITGFLDGLKSAWDSVKSWLQEKVQDLPQWLKDALGIASPPQWAISAGQDIVKGLQQGLDLSSLQGKIMGAINIGGMVGGIAGNVGGTVIFAEGAFAGAFPSVTDGRDAEGVMSEVQRLVQKGYLAAQVPGGVTP